MTGERLSHFLPEWVYRETGMRSDIREIRLRPRCPVIAFADKPFFVGRERILSENEFKICFEKMCKNSVYHAQKDLAYGFITLDGGHRAGVCGKIIYEADKIKAMIDISSICIRIAREIKGASNNILPHIISGKRIYNTLIISPPGCGKTTLLRDIARILGGREHLLRVGIIDERGEICAMNNGISTYDIGVTSYVLSECRKSDAMEMLLRSMAPDVIITDEIGNENDGEAIFKTINCGVKIICTCHGYDLEDAKRKRAIKELVEMDIFEKIIVLTDIPLPGTVCKIYGERECI